MGMKTIKVMMAAVLMMMVGSPLCAQRQQDASHNYNQAMYYRQARQIDWLPDAESNLHCDISAGQIRRYSLAVHPFYGLKDGLKLDFEMELPRPGKWLQFGVMGYYAPKMKNDEKEGWYYDRANLASGYEYFDGMAGGGFSIAYKAMLSHSGFYYSAGLSYNYYSVDYRGIRYRQFQEDGLSFYERVNTSENTRFHQPALTVNAGKHIALSKTFFMDLFIGAGYMHSLYSGPEAFTNPNPTSFGYRGAYFNGGLRLGIFWRDRYLR
jgi:hypothetical protein